MSDVVTLQWTPDLITRTISRIPIIFIAKGFKLRIIRPYLRLVVYTHNTLTPNAPCHNRGIFISVCASTSLAYNNLPSLDQKTKLFPQSEMIGTRFVCVCMLT